MLASFLKIILQAFNSHSSFFPPSVSLSNLFFSLDINENENEAQSILNLTSLWDQSLIRLLDIDIPVCNADDNDKSGVI